VPDARPPGRIASFFAVVVAIAVATAVGWTLRRWVSQADQVMLLLLVVTTAALRYGLAASIFAATLATLAYDVFFVPPFFTLRVDDTRHLLTFGMLFGEGILVSVLMTRIRRAREEALLREARTAALYALSRRLAAASTESEVACALAEELGRALHRRCHVGLTCGESITFVPPAVPEDEPRFGAMVRWVREAGKSPPPGAWEGWQALPVSVGAEVAAVVLHFEAESFPGGTELQSAAVRQAASALERLRLAAEARQATLRADLESQRHALLSSVSHDLRTPLGAIQGAATALQQPALADETTRRDLLGLICDEASRMDRLVANLLDMTRLSASEVPLQRQWVPWDEIVGSALAREAQVLQRRALQLHLDAAVPLAFVDPMLIEQLLTNLLENAAKYTPPDSELELVVRPLGAGVAVALSDRGPGIAPIDVERIFQRFQRGTHSGVGGAGLGLAICRAIARAHGGDITALPRDGGGTTFQLVLPAAPPLPTLERGGEP